MDYTILHVAMLGIFLNLFGYLNLSQLLNTLLTIIQVKSMNKTLRLTISIIGLLAVIAYMLYFFRVIENPAVPWMAGGIVIAVYIFGIYAKKMDSKED